MTPFISRLCEAGAAGQKYLPDCQESGKCNQLKIRLCGQHEQRLLLWTGG